MLHLSEEVYEGDGVLVSGLDVSVGAHFKNAALKYRKSFKLIDVNKQTLVSLGLDSILNLSFQHSEAQTTLFSINQWKELKSIFPHTKYNVKEYDGVKKNVSQVAESYKSQKPWSSNWKVMHKKLKFLKTSFDLEENEEYDAKTFA